jgi:hypothetical protein
MAAAGMPSSPGVQAAGAPAAPPVVEPAAVPAVVPPVVETPVASPVAPAWAPPQMTQEEFNELRRFAELGFRASQQPQPTAPASMPVAPPAAVAPHPITGVIPFTEQDKQWLQTSADGKLEAVPGAPADILQRYHQHQASQVRFFREFAQDPEKYLGQMIEKRAAEIAARTFEERQSQTSTQETARRIMAENQNWIYQADASGKPAVDVFGRPKFTDNGSLFMGFVENLHANGMKDPTALFQTAKQMLIGHLFEQQQARTPAAPAAPASPVQLTDEQRRNELLARAASAAAQAPINAATISQPAPQGKPKDFRSFFQAEALAQGIRV